MVDIRDHVAPPSDVARTVVASDGIAGGGVGDASGPAGGLVFMVSSRYTVTQPCWASVNWTRP